MSAVRVVDLSESMRDPARRVAPSGGGRVPTVVAVLIGSVTAFFAIDGGHHTWPGGPTGNGGLDPTDFPASAIAWCASGLTATPPPVDDCAGVLAAHGLTGDTGATGS